MSFTTREHSALPSYGLIVEGDSDEGVFSQLIRRVNSPEASIYPLRCGGVGTLMKEFPVLLKRFEFAHHGGPVTAALVIRDGDGKATEEVLHQMREKLGNRTYRFDRLELCVIQRNTDTWLLADHNAVNTVARSRNGRNVAEVNGTLEDIEDPKSRMRALLTAAKLNYTPAVLTEIAGRINLDTLTYRLRSYQPFQEAVLRAQGGEL